MKNEQGTRTSTWRAHMSNDRQGNTSPIHHEELYPSIYSQQVTEAITSSAHGRENPHLFVPIVPILPRRQPAIDVDTLLPDFEVGHALQCGVHQLVAPVPRLPHRLVDTFILLSALAHYLWHLNSRYSLQPFKAPLTKWNILCRNPDRSLTRQTRGGSPPSSNSTVPPPERYGTPRSYSATG